VNMEAPEAVNAVLHEVVSGSDDRSRLQP
jgi:hypothetical protein